MPERSSAQSILDSAGIASVCAGSDERYRIMAEALPYGIWLSDKDGETQYLSPSFLDLLGMSLNEAKGFGWAARLQAGESGPILNRWLQCIKTGEDWEGELRIADRDGRIKTILSRGRPIRDSDGAIINWAGINLDITQRKAQEDDIQKLEWLLTGRCSAASNKQELPEVSNELTSFNVNGEILISVGKTVLADIVRDYVDLLDTSVSVLERNGDCALSITSSGWCRFLHAASRDRCSTSDTRAAIESGNWLCHACINRAAQSAMEKGIPIDVECPGGIRIYAVPIRAGEEIIGSIKFGYGDPPSDPARQKEIALRYNVQPGLLRDLARYYESRPQFIIDLAKNRLLSSARLIGTIVERHRGEIALQKAYSEIEQRIEARSIALSRSYELLQEETRERLRAERELLQRHDALESVYAMATAFGPSSETMYAQVALSIANILGVSYAALARYEKGELRDVAQISSGELSHISSVSVRRHPCGIAISIRKPCQFTHNLNEQFPLCMSEFRTMNSYIGVPLFTKSGEILGAICALDESDRVFNQYEIHLIEIFGRYMTHEIERSVMEQHLLAAQELKMLGQLTSGVAHEVRNPLNAIQSITDALSAELGDNPDYQIYMLHIQKQVKRLSDLMRDLLDLGRPIESRNLAPISLESLISSALFTWQNSSQHTPRRIHIRDTEGIADQIVLADRLRIDQVFVNILENACDCSHPETDIEIVLNRADHGMAIIRIVDHGSGIKSEYEQYLFSPFFTTRRGGTGLGLGIVKRIMECHGGSVLLYNNDPPPGATAELHIPLTGNTCITAGK